MQNSIRGNKRILVRLKRKIRICNIEQHTDDNIMKKQVCQIAQSAAKNMLKQSEIAENFLEICCLQKICPVDKFAIINMGVDAMWIKLWISEMDENRKIQSRMIPKITSAKYSVIMLIAE